MAIFLVYAVCRPNCAKFDNRFWQNVNVVLDYSIFFVFLKIPIIKKDKPNLLFWVPNEISKQVKCSYLLSFQYACLSHCNLSGANLSNCCLERADLSHANLEGAQLIGVKALCANMEGIFYSAFQLIILIKSWFLVHCHRILHIGLIIFHCKAQCVTMIGFVFGKKIWKTLSTRPDLNNLTYFAYGLP